MIGLKSGVCRKCDVGVLNSKFTAGGGFQKSDDIPKSRYGEGVFRSLQVFEFKVQSNSGVLYSKFTAADVFQVSDTPKSKHGEGVFGSL